MSQTGEIDPTYIAARAVLLDALAALGGQRDAVVLIGAQAIYLHTGEAELGIGLYTTDGDLAIVPADLRPDPLLEELFEAAAFKKDEENLGTWLGRGDVKIDLLVPQALASGGRRSADLGVQGRRTARRARGLEAAAIENELMTISSLDPEDERTFRIRVAAPAALLVAKLHKLGDRAGTTRVKPKDALDVLRLLELPSESLAERLDVLTEDETAGGVTTEGIAILQTMFGSPECDGCGLAAEALRGRRDEAIVRESCAALTDELVSKLSHSK